MLIASQYKNVKITKNTTQHKNVIELQCSSNPLELVNLVSVDWYPDLQLLGVSLPNIVIILVVNTLLCIQLRAQLRILTAFPNDFYIGCLV